VERFARVGDQVAPLRDYLITRGIEKVPVNARIVLDISYSHTKRLAHDPGMVLPDRDYQGTLQGILVTWLNPGLTGKREGEANALAAARPKYPDCEVRMATPVKPKALRFNKTKRTIVPGGLPSGSNYNEVVCPARASATHEREGEFLKLSSLLASQPAPAAKLQGVPNPARCWARFHFDPKSLSPLAKGAPNPERTFPP
jgi:hypothetical protein